MLCGTAGLRTGHQLGVAVPPVDMPRCQAEKGQCPTRGRVPSASCYGPGHCMPSPESPRAAPTKDRTETSRPPHMLLHWHTKLSASNQDKTIRADNEWSHQSGSLARKQGKPFCGIPVPAAPACGLQVGGLLGKPSACPPTLLQGVKEKGENFRRKQITRETSRLGFPCSFCSALWWWPGQRGGCSLTPAHRRSPALY